MTAQFARELAVKLRELVAWQVDARPPSLDEWVLAAAADICDELALQMLGEETR